MLLSLTETRVLPCFGLTLPTKQFLASSFELTNKQTNRKQSHNVIFFAEKSTLHRRSNVTISPSKCYLSFFAGNQEPVGLPSYLNTTGIKYICETLLKRPPKKFYYAIKFDGVAGIAVFSAYTVNARDAAKIGKANRTDCWRKERGLWRIDWSRCFSLFLS